MKNHVLGIVFFGLFIPNIVLAEGLYFGLKGANLTLSNADGAYQGTTSSKNIGVVVGLDISESLSFEGEYTTSVINGTIDAGIPTIDFAWNLGTSSIYGVFRTSSELYLKAKAGYINTEAKIIATSAGNSAESAEASSGLSYGIGAGLYLDERSRIEVEYTTLTTKISMLSFAYLF